MTIFITNLEDCLEDISDDEMQLNRGGINVSCEASSLEARDTRNILQDAAIGAGAGVLLASLGQRFANSATYVRGIAQDPTTRRI